MIKKVFSSIYDFFFGDPYARRARKADKKYQAWLKRYKPSYTKTAIKLLKVYETRSGINFYILTDPLDMTRERAARIEEEVKRLEFGVDKTYLVDLLDKLDKDLDGFRFSKLTAKAVEGYYDRNKPKLKEALYRIENIKAEEVLLEVALLFFYIEGENPYAINELTQKNKRKIAEEDDELRAFFTRTVELLYRTSTDTSGRDLIERSKDAVKERKEELKNQRESRITKEN